MLNLFNNSSKTFTIKCPQCTLEQEVPSRALSVYCKNCRSRIDIMQMEQDRLGKQKKEQLKPKTKNVSCPVCHSAQEVLDNAISAYCKNCHHRITVEKTKKTEFNEPVQTTDQRDIICPHCGVTQAVPGTALSTFCSECGNRINLQNYQIRGRFRGELDTKGSIYISSDGDVEGNINTGSLIVAGAFKGEVIADQKIELKSTGKIFGKVRAPAFSVDPGAVFIGKSHIGKQI